MNQFLDDHVEFKYFDGEENELLKEHFKEAVRQFTLEEREQMFFFWTGMRRLPPGGLTSLKYRCTVEHSPHESTDRLPMPTTCMNVLLVPGYSSVEMAKEKLRKGWEYGMNFGRM